MAKQKQVSATSKANEKTVGSQDAIELLKADHRAVEALFEKCRSEGDSSKKAEYAREIAEALAVHTLIEEEIFYPACRQAGVQSNLLDEAQVEHDGAKQLITELASGSPGQDQYFDAKIIVLSEYIRHHVAEEEKPRTGIFSKAKESGVELAELGKRIQARKDQLKAGSDRAWEDLQIRSIQGVESDSVRKEMGMSSRYREPERDERGRFMSEDDNYRERGREDDYRSRGRGDYDDDRQSGGGARGWYGDSQGHSEAARRSRGGDDDYESGRGGGGRSGRGQGGWSGSPERDSEASQRGWEERGGGSRGYSRGRSDEDDNGRRGRSQGGWFGDPEGHSEASRRGWEERGGGYRGYSRGRSDDDDNGRRGRGHGGWFGDPEGHSEASQRGWEERGGSRGSRSRSDDDDNGRRGRGHGGWFGDPEGHAEAARQRNR